MFVLLGLFVFVSVSVYMPTMCTIYTREGRSEAQDSALRFPPGFPFVYPHARRDSAASLSGLATNTALYDGIECSISACLDMFRCYSFGRGEIHSIGFVPCFQVPPPLGDRKWRDNKY
jgi:hypothetical protein